MDGVTLTTAGPDGVRSRVIEKMELRAELVAWLEGSDSTFLVEV